jgi:plasmid maintenance system antidote protein VapI
LAAHSKDTDTAANDLGARLRSIRTERGLTLGDVAKMASLPLSTISKMENGHTAFTYDKMLKLKEALDIDLGELIAEQPAAPAATAQLVGRRSVTRAGEGPVVASGSYQHRHLATDVLNKHFIPMVGDITARSLEEFGPLIRHGGEEFVYVLEGVLELHTELYAMTRLEAGDSTFFDSDMGHAYISGSDEPCRILSVCWTRDKR